MAIHYLVGDATRPEVPGKKIIAHVCNDKGLWGKGFVLAISERWPHIEGQFKLAKVWRLGWTQFVEADDEHWIANMVAQHDIFPRGGIAPIRYDALRYCLRDVRYESWEYRAREVDVSIHMPRIGCGLAGGSWDIVGQIVKEELVGCEVFVYDFTDVGRKSYVPHRAV